MFLFLCSLLVLFTSFWIIIKWRRVKTFWLDRGVPHYPPHPIVGSLTFLQRENPVSFEQSDKSVFIYCSICGILWLPKQVVPIKNIVASYDWQEYIKLAKNCCQSDFIGYMFCWQSSIYTNKYVYTFICFSLNAFQIHYVQYTRFSGTARPIQIIFHWHITDDMRGKCIHFFLD